MANISPSDNFFLKCVITQSSISSTFGSEFSEIRLILAAMFFAIDLLYGLNVEAIPWSGSVTQYSFLKFNVAHYVPHLMSRAEFGGHGQLGGGKGRGIKPKSVAN